MSRAFSSIFLVALLTAQNADATPTGAELLEVCESALKSNFRGVRGKMCTWYVTPCNCDAAPGLPRVCLTAPIEPPELAFTVTQVLKAIPEFQLKDAEEAVALILSEVYPCKL